MSKRIDITGQKFGRLTVIEYSHKTSSRASIWKCLCECGKEVFIHGAHLKDGHTKSCGCYKSKFLRTAETPSEISARSIWSGGYSDGCSFEKFMELSQLPCHYCGVEKSNCYNRYRNKNGDLINKCILPELA